MAKTKLCDLCNHEMKIERRECVFRHGGDIYHAEANVYYCNVCGYEKLTSGQVQFWEDDKPPEEKKKNNTKAEAADQTEPKTEATEAQEKTENNTEEKEIQPEEKRPKIFTETNGKRIVSDEWLDWMLERHSWFHGLYKRFVSKQRQEQRYLKNHVPKFKAIINDVMYDTETSKLFLVEEKNLNNTVRRHYYYQTKTGRFFRIIASCENTNEFANIELQTVKKLLSNKPDIYKEIIPGEIEE